MIIPIRDLYGLKAQRELRFGHSGLIVVIKGHEELFLEFSSSRCRKACVALLEKRMEEVQLRSERGEADPAKLEAPVMEDLDQSAETERRQSIPPVGPSPMFGSTTSTFLEFKPDPMMITCLTIGSRGDVQPYICWNGTSIASREKRLWRRLRLKVSTAAMRDNQRQSRDG
jgi:sterol 3beta-glucosyltransferase